MPLLHNDVPVTPTQLHIASTRGQSLHTFPAYVPRSNSEDLRETAIHSALLEMFGQLAGCLLDWLSGWLAAFLTGWLAGWLHR